MEECIHSFILNTPVEYWIALGVLFILLYTQMHFYFRYYNKIIRYNRKVAKGKINFTNQKPPVSVIICAQNEAENLEKYLPAVLEQDYPEFQVIVINDGSTDQSNELLERLDKKYPNLYHSFLPMDAQYMSRKKMCLSVGFKAAKYDHILLLDADSEPDSKNWISQIMSNYVDGTEIVLGYSKSNVKNNLLGKIIRYDTLTSAMRYMGFALRGRPYEGVSRNLSYKKEKYFNSLGFSNQLNLSYGDDTLFIQQIATSRNTRVAIHPDSLTTTHREETVKSYFYQKELLLKTIKKYKKGILFSMSIENISRLLFYLVFTLLFVFFLLKQQWILAGITLLFFLFRYITQINIIRKSAKILKEKPQFLLIPILDILLPLLSAYLLTIGKSSKKSNNWR